MDKLTKLREILEDEMSILKESNTSNDINHPEYIKGAVYGIRYALKSLEYITNKVY